MLSRIVSNRTAKSLSAAVSAAVLALAAFGIASVSAQEADAVHGAKTVGALAFETRGLATTPADVQRQGGFVAPAAVHWSVPAETLSGAVYGSGSVGALVLETRGLATSLADVRRQGGAMTADTVRWVSAPAR